MGNLLSKYWFYQYSTPQILEGNQSNSTSTTLPEQCCQQQLQLNSRNEGSNEEEATVYPSAEIKPGFETPQKTVVKNQSKIFAAYVPDSPERFSFNDFNELKTFLNSPVGKKKGTRFKPCQDEKELEIFFTEQISTYPEDSNTSSSSSIEADLPYKEIPAKRLTEFRMAIEKQEHSKFDELLRENPRFIVNTSNDLPTIVHIGTRYNALHVACRSGNLIAAQKILCLITDKNWLTDAYATDTCVEERSQNLLDAMLNTPDKIENNTPLHYACKFANDGIVETLLRYKDCNREPVNSHGEHPYDMIGIAAKGNKQELKDACNRIQCAFRKEPFN